MKRNHPFYHSALLLKLTGVARPNNMNRFTLLIYRTVFVTTLICLFLSGVTKVMDDMTIRFPSLESLMVCFAVIPILLKYRNLLSRRDELLQMIETASEMYTEASQDVRKRSILEKYAAVSQRITMAYGISFSGILAGKLLATVSWVLFWDTSNGLPMPFDFYLPWDTQEYVMLSFISIYLMMVPALLIVLREQNLLSSFAMQICGQIEIISQSLEHLFLDSSNQDCSIKELRDTVDLHCNVLR